MYTHSKCRHESNFFGIIEVGLVVRTIDQIRWLKVLPHILVTITLHLFFFKKGKQVLRVERTVLKRFSRVRTYHAKWLSLSIVVFSMLKTALYNIPFCSYIINLRCGFTGLFIDIDIIFAPVFPMCLRHRWTFARCSKAQARVHDIHRKSVYLNYKIDPIKHIS